ncbi:unnamed protein product [Symbiodinium natans]|uniref:Uncharacterized protein n=1 Tax=Symbiodinium natans TaxID=878477 RepID=A0A812QKH7_9DINO|nr:unnamed protein product [Symbiodinium natans]
MEGRSTSLCWLVVAVLSWACSGKEGLAAPTVLADIPADSGAFLLQAEATSSRKESPENVSDEVALELAGDLLHPLSTALGDLSWPHWGILSRKFWQCGLHWFLAILAGAATGLLLVPAVFLALALLGFTTGGVLAGSFAACCQARIGAVAAGSCFSLAQSMAATGMMASCTPCVVVSTSMTGAAVASYLMYMNHCAWFNTVCCHDDWCWWTNITHTQS